MIFKNFLFPKAVALFLIIFTFNNKNYSKNIYFISGAAGSGKKKVYEKLEQTFKDNHNLLYIPKPTSDKIKDALEKSINTNNNSSSIIVSDISIAKIYSTLGEAPTKQNIFFILLDCDDLSRMKRLKNLPLEVCTRASFLRINAQNPYWNADLLKHEVTKPDILKKIGAMENWLSFAKTKSIDTSNLTIEEVFKEVSKNIAEETVKAQKVIFLNGGSSSGKTTLAKFLQNQAFLNGEDFLHLGIDDPILMMPHVSNDWSGLGQARGFWWQHLTEFNNYKRVLLRQGDLGEKIITTFRMLALAIVESGNNLIIEDIADQERLEIWKSALKKYNTVFVKLDANLESLSNREKERNFKSMRLGESARLEGGAIEQSLRIHHGNSYDLEIDLDKFSLELAFSKIMTNLENNS